MARIVCILLGSVAIAYLILCAGLFFYQRSMIYFPRPASANVGTTLTLPVAGTRVLVSTRPKDGPRALLYFGGNAEDVSQDLPGFSLAFPDSALYLLYYRGYGGSSGKPSEQALFSDALILFDQAHAQHPEIEIVGRSLGSAIALYVASRRPVTRLVLVTPFDSLQEIARTYLPYFPVRWLLLDKYESWRYAPQVTAPTRIIAAELDEIVPRASTELLHSRFRGGIASLKVVSGAGHNTISDRGEYLELLKGAP